MPKWPGGLNDGETAISLEKAEFETHLGQLTMRSQSNDLISQFFYIFNMDLLSFLEAMFSCISFSTEPPRNQARGVNQFMLFFEKFIISRQRLYQ